MVPSRTWSLVPRTLSVELTRSWAGSMCEAPKMTKKIKRVDGLCKVM